VDGSKSFDIDLLVGAGYVSHEVFFNGTYNAAWRGKRVSVRANLLVVNKVEP